MSDFREPPWAPGMRFLTEDEAPIALSFKDSYADFIVDEISSFEPSGTGEHFLLRIEKRGLSTTDLVRHVAGVLDIGVKDIGWAGRKDARAITRQWISVPALCEASFTLIETDKIRLLETARNDRKLRIGALAGNRFELRLSGIASEDRIRAERSLSTLAARGLPNYFGAQRFGRNGYGYELGRALMEQDWHAYFVQLTSPRHALDSEAVVALHTAIVSGERSQLRSVKHLVPDLPREFCALAKQISRRAGNWESALRAMDRKTLRFHLTSFQSRLFNRVLAARIESFDRPGLGDLAQVHPARSFFEVTAEEDLAEVERRARDGEISPTGPMFGSRAPLAIGTPGEIELEALKAEGISPEIFSKRVPSVELAGERRSLRARISDLLFRWEDGVLQLNFSLPPGSYATTLIAELSKTP